MALDPERPGPDLGLDLDWDYRLALRRFGNPCYACGTRNRKDARTCKRCALPLPIAVPLRHAQAEEVVGKALENRRRYGQLGLFWLLLLCVVIALLLLPLYLPQLESTWTAFYLYTGGVSALGIATMVAGGYYQYRAFGITRAQVAIFQRTAKARLAARNQQRVAGKAPAASLPGSPLPLGSAAPSGSLAPLPGLAYGSGSTPMESFHFAGRELVLTTGLQLRGFSSGYVGEFWKLAPPGGGELLTMVIDTRATKVWQLEATTEEVASTMRQSWGVFHGGTLVGSFVEEDRVDEAAGTGQMRRTFYDVRGAEVLRAEGTFVPFPANVGAVVGAYRSARFFAGGSKGPMVLAVSPMTSETVLLLEGASGPAVVRASPSGAVWNLTFAEGVPPMLPALAALAVLSWEPDGISLKLARGVETNPMLADALAKA